MSDGYDDMSSVIVISRSYPYLYHRGEDNADSDGALSIIIHHGRRASYRKTYNRITRTDNQDSRSETDKSVNDNER